MKKNILILVLAATGLVACTSDVDQIKHFVPGTYVNQAVSEFSIANDTLLIESNNSDDTIYRVIRKTGYRRFTDGKQQALQHRVRHWTGVWDQQKQILEILQTGKVLTFYPDKGSLLNGNSQYKKL